ncbi:MAG: hypothetical protein K2M63_09240 [Muribaculaceae bacterium]|nr:hypothetical protein [Muribaculaceae bacterium]
MAINRQYSVSISNSIEEININIISIPEDRLRNIITSHYNHLNKSKDYIGAVALSITLLIVLLTSEFKNFILEAPTWKAFFVMLFILSLGYTFYCGYNAFRHRDSVRNIIDDIINDNCPD